MQLKLCCGGNYFHQILITGDLVLKNIYVEKIKQITRINS